MLPKPAEAAEGAARQRTSRRADKKIHPAHKNKKELCKMTKKQFIGNCVLFLPLLIINFFAYGLDGSIRFVQDLNKYRKKYFSKTP